MVDAAISLSAAALDSDPDLRQKIFGLPEIISDWLPLATASGPLRILDFGCGHGETALGMAMRFPAHQIDGVDLATSETALAKRIQTIFGVPSLPRNMRLRTITAGEELAEPQSYDFIYSWSVVEHIDRKILQTVLGQLRDVLKDHGRLMIQIAPLYYSAFGHHVSWAKAYEWAHVAWQGNHFEEMICGAGDSASATESLRNTYATLNRLTAEELKHLLEDCGFAVERQYRTKLAEGKPNWLDYAYRKDVTDTEQVVLLLRKERLVQRIRKLDQIDGIGELDALAARALGPWWSDLPSVSLGLGRNLYEQSDGVRICREFFGDLSDFSVLEVGPRDGYHSYGLEKLGASVLAVESARGNYLRCLHLKNIYDLKARFVLGDVSKVLQANDRRFDLTFLSGVIYHFRDPIRTLGQLLAQTDRVYVWTHVWDEFLIAANQATRGEGKLLAEMFEGREVVRAGGNSFTYHLLRYDTEMQADENFSGGISPEAAWLTLDDMIKVFEMNDFVVGGITKFDHAGGPAVEFCATRRETYPPREIA